MSDAKTKTPTNPLKSILETLRPIGVLARSLLTRSPNPSHKGNQTIKGLDAPVEVIWDHWDVPHIYAESMKDGLFTQGFIHAQERLWQMDFNRRLGAGRLSEILGADAIPLDRWLRTLGIRRISEAQPAETDPQALSLLEAYAAGVNAYIDKGVYPVEMALLDYHPEPWSPADSIAWTKMMAWELSVNWETEILRAKLIDKLGLEKAAELEPPFDDTQPFIIPEGVDYSCIGGEALRKAEAARPFTGPPAQDGLGSNNWVLSGERTKTGMPLLANDMHLGMTIPSIWFENHLIAGDLNISGVSLPGVPSVIAGHNQHVAWGFTNGFTDVQDLFIEHIKRGEDGRTLYEYQGGWLEAEVIQEVIRVKDGDPVNEDVIITHHGPIINSLLPDFPEEDPLALCWTALELDESVLALFHMNLAKSCTEFREALRRWPVPSQNMVYADTQGNIGYTLPGKLPIREKGNGRVPVPGWTGEYDWQGYVPFEELPHMYNPEPGYIATANNKVVDDGYPHWIGYDFVTGNRAQRIVEMIESQEKLGRDDIREMHIDLKSPAARRIRDVLSRLESDSADLSSILERIRNWNGELAADSPEAAVYQIFTRKVIYRLLEPVLGDLTIRYAGKGPTPIIKEGSMLGERSRDWLMAILEAPSSHWFDLGDGLTRDDHILAALQDAINDLKKTCGPEIEDWNWGKLHTLTFNHTMGSVKPLDRFFNRGPYPIGGDGTTVNASHATFHDLNSHTIVGPPFRFIADLSDWNQSLGILVPGQSGHRASPAYDNNIEAWSRGDYHPMVFDREVVMAAKKEVMNLKPKVG